MEYTIIDVPDMNDSVSRIVLKGKPYFIRFSYNDTFDYWKLNLYDTQYTPLAVGIKIVPRFPLNVFLPSSKLPFGAFVVQTKLDRIGRNDFKNGAAKFCFLPIDNPI